VHETGGFSDVTLFQTFNPRGQLFQENALIGQTSDFANTYTYSPDALGDMTAIFQLAGGRGKRVVFVVNQIGQTTSIDRQTNATLRKGGSGNSIPGAYRGYGYDKAGELTAIGKGGKRTENTITRDTKHRVTALSIDGGPARSYDYYFDDELKSAPSGSSGNTTQTFEYDKNFNRASGGSVVAEDNRLKEDASYVYRYDKEGNLVKRVTKSGGAYVEFQYDDRNRLLGASFYNSGGTLLKSVGYTYDAADRLTRRVGGAGGTRNYIYDGSAGPTASDDVIFTFANDQMNSQNLISRYLLGPSQHQVLAEDTPGLNTLAGTPTRWYESDYLGTPRKVLDDHGTLLSSLDYDAWGQLTNHTGPVPLVGYTGQRADVDTSFVLMGKRWYQPLDGRFTSEDPLAEGTNVTDYVRNDPMNYTDPTGMQAFKVSWDDGLNRSVYWPSSSYTAPSSSSSMRMESSFYFSGGADVSAGEDFESPPPRLSPGGSRLRLLMGDDPNGAPGSGWVIKPNGTMIEVPDVRGHPAIQAWAQGYITALTDPNANWPSDLQTTASPHDAPEMFASIYMGQTLETLGFSREEIGGAVPNFTGALAAVGMWLHDMQISDPSQSSSNWSMAAMGAGAPLFGKYQAGPPLPSNGPGAAARMRSNMAKSGVAAGPAPVLVKTANGAFSPIPESYLSTEYKIDMRDAPAGSATNAAGYARNGPWFWRQMLAKNPKLFSDSNAAAIRAARAPVVDSTWIKYNPSHQAFEGEKLIHHHLNQGAEAVGLPEPIHQSYHGTLHPER
jgi:RHS repeat-associated protein